MPIYEYQCGLCGEKKEVFNPKETPICCMYAMTKLVSKTSFKLEGDCWEQDGYGRSKSK